MVTRWGTSDELGPVTLASRDDVPAGFGTSKPYSEATAHLIDLEVQRILQESHAEAALLLLEYRSQLDARAEALLEHETLEEQEIPKLTGLPRSPVCTIVRYPSRRRHVAGPPELSVMVRGRARCEHAPRRYS